MSPLVDKSYFPLLISYVDNKATEADKRIKVNTPEDLESGRAFIVLETNTRK